MTDMAIRLNDLPFEILESIISLVPNPSDVNSMAISCHHLHSLITGNKILQASWLWTQHGNQALFMAREIEDLTLIRTLINVHGADVNTRTDIARPLGSTLLHQSCIHHQLDIINFILSLPTVDVNIMYSGTVCLTLDLKQAQRGP